MSARFLRRLFGLDFPDPKAGQVWRSRYSGRAIRVESVRRSDCGDLWHITLQHEHQNRFLPIGMAYCMFPSQWRRMLRTEGRRLMGDGAIEPSQPWPRSVTRTPAAELTRLADAFERSADWLDKGVLTGSRRTHPLVGTADYRKAAEALRRAAGVGEPDHV